MSPITSKLKRLHLMDSLVSFSAATQTRMPGGGWVRAIREALGMTQGQLGERIKVSRQSIQDFERAEADRRITMESLDRLAAAMGCKVVYALVPEYGTLEDIRVARATVLADSLLKPGAHSMKLEAQGLKKEEHSRQRALLVEDLLGGSSRKLWQ